MTDATGSQETSGAPWWQRLRIGGKRPAGWPDLRRYRKPAAFYYDLHVQSQQPAVGSFNRASERWQKRVTAQWGLIARGRDSIPYLQRMLASRNPDTREDGAGIFAALGRSDPSIVDSLLAALAEETDDQPRDSIVLALGSLRSRKAVPALAAIVQDESADGDTRFGAAESLGRIVERRFDKQPDPIVAALAWIRSHPADAER